MMEIATPSDDFNKVEEGFNPDKRIEVTLLRIPIDGGLKEMKFDTKSIVTIGMGILSVIPSIISFFKESFGSSSATPAEKADTLITAATGVVQTVAAVSEGGQAKSLNKLLEDTAPFKDVVTSVMQLGEALGESGSGAIKQQFFTESIAHIAQLAEKLFEGGAKTTAEEATPLLNEAANTLAPILFPKDSIAGLEASKG